MDDEIRAMLTTIVQEIHNVKEDMKKGFSAIDSQINEINGKIGDIDGRLEKVELRLEKVDSQVSALRSGQIETRKEIKEVSIKVSETYGLALESWGQSTENRKWLENV